MTPDELRVYRREYARRRRAADPSYNKNVDHGALRRVRGTSRVCAYCGETFTVKNVRGPVPRMCSNRCRYASVVRPVHRHRDGHPDHMRARWAVNNAVQVGRLPKVKTLACLDCGAIAQEYDHYLGYSEVHWYDVEPVCTSCHGRRSAERGERVKRAA